MACQLEPHSTNHQITTATFICSSWTLYLHAAHAAYLVLFYHLQKLKPEWSKAATTMNEHDATIIIGKVGITAKHLPQQLYSNLHQQAGQIHCFPFLVTV
jgi:hypothetical protein